VRQDLDHGSNHFSIATEIALNPAEAPEQRQRNWRKIDAEAVAAGAQRLKLLTQLNSEAEID
jgi:hypothetical protein